MSSQVHVQYFMSGSYQKAYSPYECKCIQHIISSLDISPNIFLDLVTLFSLPLWSDTAIEPQNQHVHQLDDSTDSDYQDQAPFFQSDITEDPQVDQDVFLPYADPIDLAAI